MSLDALDETGRNWEIAVAVPDATLDCAACSYLEMMLMARQTIELCEQVRQSM